MGQTYSVEVKNISDFVSAEISIDGRESSMVSKGRSVELRPENNKGTGKLRVYRESKLIRECSFPYDMIIVSQFWEITNDGLTQKGGYLSTPSYAWSFVDDD